jgi:hypothetical protein
LRKWAKLGQIGGLTLTHKSDILETQETRQRIEKRKSKMLVKKIDGDGFTLKIFQFDEKFNIVAYDDELDIKIALYPIIICVSLAQAEQKATEIING